VAAFASLLRPTAAATSASSNTVVVGRDSRVSGPWIQEVVVSTLTSWGFNVLLLGIVPTPTVSECLPPSPELLQRLSMGIDVWC